MVIGSIEGDDRVCQSYVREVGCVVASVGYRLAPENPYPSPVEDCFTALRWVAGHAPDLHIDASRIAIGGSSAGGGLAAGTALLARDRGGPAVRFQLLVRPMLDDRNITLSSREFASIPGWSGHMNGVGWTAYLGPLFGTEAVPQYAAPARATDLSHLPATMLQVGELEVFRDEGIEYAARLLQAGVPTELHVYPGAFHGWDGMVPQAAVSRRSIAERMRALHAAFAD
jgi:acetyl esterase/lipase